MSVQNILLWGVRQWGWVNANKCWACTLFNQMFILFMDNFEFEKKCCFVHCGQFIDGILILNLNKLNDYHKQ